MYSTLAGLNTRLGFIKNAFLTCIALMCFCFVLSYVHVSWHTAASDRRYGDDKGRFQESVTRAYLRYNVRQLIAGGTPMTVSSTGALYRINIRQEFGDQFSNISAHKLANYKSTCWLRKELGDSSSLYSSNKYGKNLCVNGGTGQDHCRKDFLTMRKIYQQAPLSAGGTYTRVRCLPYVYLVGVTKAGTTDLFDKLLLHQDFVEPSMKEPMYFTRNRLGERNVKVTFRDYVDLFDLAAYQISRQTNNSEFHSKITIDGSPNNFWEIGDWKQIPWNTDLEEPLITTAHSIYAVNPDAKIIVMLRNPTDRCFSHVNMRLKLSVEEFDSAARTVVDLFKTCIQNKTVRACAYDPLHGVDYHMKSLYYCIKPSLYSIYMADYLSVFPRQQLLVLRAEDYYSNRTSTLLRITTFLSIDPYPEDTIMKIVGAKARNTGRKDSMSNATRDFLDDFFKPFNLQLARLLGSDSFLWLSSGNP